MKNVFMAAVLLAIPAQSFAAAAFYTTLGVQTHDGANYPGVMIAIGEPDLCTALRQEIEASLAESAWNNWIKKTHAFVVVRNDTYDISGTFDIRPDDLSAKQSPLVTATAYDVRYNDGDKPDFTHRVQAGQVRLGAADIINQQPLPISLDFEFQSGGPALGADYQAQYCPAMAAVTQLWTR